MMRHRLILCVLSASALLLAACSNENASLEKLRTAKTTSDAYGRTLAKGYQAYALEREKAEDYKSSAFFAEKGLKAAFGDKVGPESPDTWQFESKESSLGLAFARERLLKSLNNPHIGKEGALAAETVLSYDCWLDQESSKRDIELLRVCQQEYFEQTASLTDALMLHEKRALEEKAAIEAQELAAKEAEKAKEVENTEPVDTAPQSYEPVPIESTSTIIYFPFDSDRPGEVASQLLDELIRYILNAKNVHVLIHGHADRAGTDAYNMALSERRAAYVRGRMVEAGVEDKNIEHYGFGETDPKVPTADGVREPYNRRVEIFIE